METSEAEVEHYLAEFRYKLSFREDFILRDDRGKNMLTIAELGLSKFDIMGILKQLKAGDYSEGPIEDTLYKETPMWVFGKMVKGEEIYIKITMGKLNSDPVCISFHKAERKMNYPLKR